MSRLIHVSTNVLGCGFLGIAVGAGVGALIAGGKGADIGASIGALVGGGIGGVIGNKIADQEDARKAAHEKIMRQMDADIEASRQRFRDRVDNLFGDATDRFTSALNRFDVQRIVDAEFTVVN